MRNYFNAFENFEGNQIVRRKNNRSQNLKYVKREFISCNCRVSVKIITIYDDNGTAASKRRKVCKMYDHQLSSSHFLKPTHKM